MSHSANDSMYDRFLEDWTDKCHEQGLPEDTKPTDYAFSNWKEKNGYLDAHDLVHGTGIGNES